jgi:haloalkane dehalogenase
MFGRVTPGAEGQEHTTIANGGHFLQEDQGEKVAELLIKFIADKPKR